MMMRASLLALLAASPAFAQNASDYLTGLFTTLNGAGLTRLVSSAGSIANTTAGQALISSLPSGNNTLFAPNNGAFNGTPPENINDPNIFATILSYHTVAGSISTSNISAAPANTILRTFMNSSQWAQLEGSKGQVLVLTNSNGTVRILDQNTPVQVVSSTTYQNLVIHVVDAIIDPPPTLSAALQSNNLSSLSTAAQQGGVLSALEATHGVTIFAPTDAAFTSGLAALGGNSTNQTTITNVLENHVINGTSVYSSLLNASNYTSAGGEPFTFATNGSGTYVSSGSSTARIVTPDVLLTNGVLHIIDGVLLNTESNTAAASSALASATSVAGQSATQTGPVGGATTSSGSNGNGNSNAAMTLELPLRQWAIALCLSLGGAALVL